ncbi:MAG: FAD-dependent oxidoreductase [Bacillota bacterium]|nr:FAD-dependent oxidoreductase [Bacillota bacterium]
MLRHRPARTIILIAILLILALAGCGARPPAGPPASPRTGANPPAPPPVPETCYDLVVYGGSFAGCAAVAQAAYRLPADRTVALVVPESALGSIGTVGGQNYFDIRRWKGRLVTQGSFRRWLDAYGQGYPTAAMAEILKQDLLCLGGDHVTILFRHEVESLGTTAGGRITHVDVRPVARDPESLEIHWAGPPRRLSAALFIDASDTGRLTRLAGVPVTSGRYDRAGDNYQQTATLMFKVRGLDVDAALAYRDPSGGADFKYGRDADLSLLGWGGGRFVWQRDPVIRQYNKQSDRFTTKPYNIAEDAGGTWWINTLMIHKVDGRLQALDRGTPRWPADAPPDAWDTDTAYRMAVAEIQSPAFLAALRRFPGFENVELVRDENGRPVVGEVLYLRETVHAVTDRAAISGDSSGTNYIVTPRLVRAAGAAGARGEDGKRYAKRVGLAFYSVDLHAYVKGGRQENELLLKRGGDPPNPFYVPWAALTTPYAPNLIIPGYAQRTASEPWGEMRVIPNLCVCGDAAGAGAAYCLVRGRDPAALTPADLAEIRRMLATWPGRAACLEK